MTAGPVVPGRTDARRRVRLIPYRLVAYAATIAALTFLYGLVAVLLTYHLAARIRANPKISTLLGKAAGMFLIGFGIKLAISK